MRSIPIIRASSRSCTLDASEVISVDGQPLASAYEAPALLMPWIVAEARAAQSQRQEVRYALLVRAGRLFSEATLAEQTPADYVREAAAASGLPVGVFARALGHYGSALGEVGAIVGAQKPCGAEPIQGIDLGTFAQAVWVPRGRVLGVMAPGNHPEAHIGWLQALAFGYNVVVKPSRRDPFTPLRLVHALIKAGFQPGEISFASGDHRAGAALIEAADVALVYGGPDVVRAFGNNRRVLVRGPGRSKVLVRVRAPVTPERLDFLVRCVAADGGTRCTNASAILVDGDHEALARALARALAQIPSVARHDERAVLASVSRAEAEAVRAAFDAVRAGVPDLCRSFDDAPAVVPLCDQTAVLRPAVVATSSASHAGFSSEFPFPCVWVAPWRSEDGLAPLRDTLALALLTDDTNLVEAALREPSIRKVFVGEVPTFHSAPLMPHDGAIADFLFETKAFSRQAGPTHG